MIQTFDSEEHYHNVLKQVSSNKYVIINFSAIWCIPCKKVAPLYESLREEDSLMTKCYFYKIDETGIVKLLTCSEQKKCLPFKYIKAKRKCLNLSVPI